MSTSLPPCRSCGSQGLVPFLDLGETPLADALVDSASPVGEEFFPLALAVCPDCSLVQILEEVPAQKLFVDNYLYFSSFSDHLLAHSRDHALGLIKSRALSESSLVVEIASNDGYLLKNFVDEGISVLGIDPAHDHARVANEIGVPTLAEFFGVELATRLVNEGKRADVIIANNVMAHVPDLNGFVAGMRVLIADDGLITVENPYVRDLIDHCEFDTVYHEHFCYYSCTAVDRLVRRHGLFLNDVEYFGDLHGGTLRWHIQPFEAVSERAAEYLAAERAVGLDRPEYYLAFGKRVADLKSALLQLLGDLRASGHSVAAYGAAAKGSTLVNHVGLDERYLDFVVDRNVHKQGKFMPGVHLPILDPSALLDRRPDYVLLLAWNFADEIVRQQQDYLATGGRFIRPVPHPEVMA
jgi:SAM-dependent methyltransferase